MASKKRRQDVLAFDQMTIDAIHKYLSEPQFATLVVGSGETAEWRSRNRSGSEGPLDRLASAVIP